jgi:hypothetical protein
VRAGAHALTSVSRAGFRLDCQTATSSLRGAKRRSNPCLRMRYHGLLRCAGNDQETRFRIPAARSRPSPASSVSLIKRRAQGMPGEGLTHGPPATKKAGGSHHRFSRIIRHSLRDGVNGCSALSLVYRY